MNTHPNVIFSLPPECFSSIEVLLKKYAFGTQDFIEYFLRNYRIWDGEIEERLNAIEDLLMEDEDVDHFTGVETETWHEERWELDGYLQAIKYQIDQDLRRAGLPEPNTLEVIRWIRNDVFVRIEASQASPSPGGTYAPYAQRRYAAT